MRIERLSLLNSLFTILNENEEQDTNYVLAHYFLENYHKIDELNIYDVAAECYVSRSSVRRFCITLGYDNFLELKQDINEYDDQYNFYISHANRPNYRETLNKEINAMIEELNIRMNTDEVDRIIDRIYDSRYVVFLSADTATSQVKDFQRAMLFHKRMIHVISEAYTNSSLISRLDKHDYLVVVSGSGTFAKASRDFVKDSAAYKVLFTYARNNEHERGFDKVYHLSAKDRGNEPHSVYGTYGFRYMFDIIYSAYTKKYGLNN